MLKPISVRCGYDDLTNAKAHDRAMCVCGTWCAEMVLRDEKGLVRFAAIHAIREQLFLRVRYTSCYDICMNMYFDDMDNEELLEELNVTDDETFEGCDDDDEPLPDTGKYRRIFELLYTLLSNCRAEGEFNHSICESFLAPYLGKDLEA